MKPEYLNKIVGNIPETVPEYFSDQLTDWLKADEKKGHQQSLYLINTRLWIAELSGKYNHPITVDTIPDKEWDSLFKKYDNFWFMGIYIPSQASKDHAKKYVGQYRYALPDINPDKDVAGSPFAIPDYVPNPQIAGSWQAWDKMVEKLHSHGKKVIIDFVPNHTGLDHPWATEHPEYYILGSEQQYHSNRDLFYRVKVDDDKIYYIAHGKDPNYPEWADTLQLNYAKAEVQEEMGNIMLKLVEHADGIRCDMAMLVNPSTFLRTWGWILNNEQRDYIQRNLFWRKKIPQAKEKAQKLGKEFEITGEIYWDKEDLGEVFDYIYDDRLYKLFLEISSGGNPQILKPHIEYLIKSSKNGRHYRDWLYTENHDEDRSAHKLGKKLSMTFAVLAGIIPDSVFMVNQGQEEGYKIRPPMQIARFPKELVDPDTTEFYDNLLTLKHSRLFQQGNWNMASISTRNSNLIALEVRSPDNTFCAVICVNPCNYEVSCSIPEVDTRKSATVISLTDSSDIKADQFRSNGIYIGLKSGEAQVVFFCTKTTELPQAVHGRQNLAVATQ